MLGSSNANIVQAYSWSCLTPTHLEPKRHPLHMSPTPVKGLDKVTVNLPQMSATLQQRGKLRPCASKPATARVSTGDEDEREEVLLTMDAEGVFATQPRQRFCTAYSKRCNKCGTLEHFVKACRNAGNVPGSVESRKLYMQPQQQQQYANQVEMEDNYANEELFMTDQDMNKQENANFLHI